MPTVTFDRYEIRKFLVAWPSNFPWLANMDSSPYVTIEPPTCGNKVHYPGPLSLTKASNPLPHHHRALHETYYSDNTSDNPLPAG